MGSNVYLWVWMDGDKCGGTSEHKNGDRGGSASLTRTQTLMYDRGKFPKNTYLMWGGMEGRGRSWMGAGWCG